MFAQCSSCKENFATEQFGAQRCPHCDAQLFLDDPNAAPPSEPEVAPSPVPAPESAFCAVHTGTQAKEICDRCGAYMCDVCTEDGTLRRCPGCRKLTGTTAFPFTRENWTFSALFDHCWTLWKADWVMYSVALLILIGTNIVLTFVGQLLQVGVAFTRVDVIIIGATVGWTFISSIIQGVLGLGFLRACIDALNGAPFDLAKLFGQIHKVGQYILLILVAMVIIVLPLVAYFGVVVGGLAATGQLENEDVALPVLVVASLIMIVPLIWVSIGLYFMQYELAHDDDVGGVEAVRRAWELVRGVRLHTFGFAFVAGLIAVLGLLACCIGIVASGSLAQLLLCALYLSLRNGSSLPPVQRVV